MSIYSVATLGEADNQITFNDYTQDPVYRILARAPSKWQIRQQDLPVPFESGSSDFLTLLGQSAYILSGKMYPASEGSYDQGLMKLRTVCSLDIEQNDPSSDLGYVPYVWADATDSKQIFMKPLYVQLAETTQQGFIQPFTIYSKIKDPTIFSSVTKVATTQSSNSSSSGAAAFPVIFPVVFGSTLLAVTATAINAGTLPGFPASIQVVGPVNNPVITNSATGEFIKVNCNLATSGNILSLLYDKDTLSITLDGVSQIQNLTSDSTLFKIQPGENNISLTGSSIGNGAYATINYYDTWPLA